MTTRANLESVLVKRAGAMMSVVSMDVTYAGSNADLNDSISYALQQAGYTVADPFAVADADVAEVSDTDLYMVLDYAELRLLETISTNLAQFVDITNGPNSEKMSQYSTALDKRIDKLQAKIDSSYGASVEVSAVHFDFATHGDDEPITE